MGNQNEFLRFTSPNEQRTVSREDAGYYYAVILGAAYEFGDKIAALSPEFFFHPLRQCVDEHPYLSVVVGDMHTDKAFFQRVPSINLRDHISILDHIPAEKRPSAIEEVLGSNLDKPFPPGIPPWRIVVLPQPGECFVAFCFSHTVGDGPTGTAFHRTFLRACQNLPTDVQGMSPVVATPMRPLPPPFDTPERLKISWGYLLAPLIALFLPSFITNFLGLRASVAKVDAGTWTGSRIFFDPKTTHSKLRLRELEASVLTNALQTTRKHDAKLTSVFLQVIARALSKSIPDSTIDKFISQVAVNMRNSVGVPADEGGEYATGCYTTHPRHDTAEWLSEESWATARSITHSLAETASNLQDQAIGLLRYLPSIRKWTTSKIGERRDCSFEVSNVGVFHGHDSASKGRAHARITKMTFAQPGHVTGAPMCFNLVSLSGGALVYTVTWTAGGLGMAEDDEDSFVDAICASVEQDLKELK